MAKKQRLDKILANLGYGTRSQLKQAARKGLIRVNDQVISDSGWLVDPEQEVILFQNQIVRYQKNVYMMLHKPAGVVSATEDRRDRTVIDLLAHPYDSISLFPVGRLDKDTEGLLLLTNDGKLSHQLLAPKKHVPKVYVAHIEWEVDESMITRFQQGITLDDGYQTMPAQLRIVSPGEALTRKYAEIELTIYEGKFHQVKRMFQAVDRKVTYLKRIAMGPLQLDPLLPCGSYRECSEAEITALKSYNL